MTRTLTSGCLAIFLAMVLMGPWCEADCLTLEGASPGQAQVAVARGQQPLVGNVLAASSTHSPAHCQPHRASPAGVKTLPVKERPCERRSHSKITTLSPTTVTVPFIASMTFPVQPAGAAVLDLRRLSFLKTASLVLLPASQCFSPLRI